MRSLLRGSRIVTVGLALTLALTACGGGGDDDAGGGDDGGGDDGGGGDSAAIDCGDTSGAEDLGGAEVSVFGAFTSVQGDATNAVIDACFNEVYNAEAFYEGSESFETQIKIRTEGGNAPDVALYPQPGSIIEQAEAGNAIALEDLGLDVAEMEDRFGEYLMSLGEYDGKHYAVPASVNLKSLIWYKLPVFESEGYEIPETWDELLALSDQMVADGYTPFCIGTGSEAATGWPATDWMEDIMLRTAGPEVYDQWVSHEIPFTDPAVVNAAETFAEIAFNEDYILGNTSQIPDLDFRDAVEPLFADPPGCLMHRQASFIVDFFPQGAVVGEDVDAFAFPDIEPGLKGALIAGDFAAVFRDAPEVQAFLDAFVSADLQCALGGQEGVQRISPNVNVSADCYADQVVATAAEAVVDAVEAGGARFDASDLMPSAVGSGSFWTAMNEWMRGADLETVLQDVEDSWPEN